MNSTGLTGYGIRSDISQCNAVIAEGMDSSELGLTVGPTVYSTVYYLYKSD